jgi:tetratricopeptide (TPR) repeat protein
MKLLNVMIKAIKIDPNYCDTFYKKGISLDDLVKYKEAIECYDQKQ